MSKRPLFIVTAYTIIYAVLIKMSDSISFLPYLYLLMPFLFCWLMYSILKDSQLEYTKEVKKTKKRILQ